MVEQEIGWVTFHKTTEQNYKTTKQQDNQKYTFTTDLHTTKTTKTLLPRKEVITNEYNGINKYRFKRT